MIKHRKRVKYTFDELQVEEMIREIRRYCKPSINFKHDDAFRKRLKNVSLMNDKFERLKKTDTFHLPLNLNFVWAAKKWLSVSLMGFNFDRSPEIDLLNSLMNLNLTERTVKRVWNVPVISYMFERLSEAYFKPSVEFNLDKTLIEKRFQVYLLLVTFPSHTKSSVSLTSIPLISVPLIMYLLISAPLIKYL